MTAFDLCGHCDTNHPWREGMSDHGLDYNVA